MTIQFVLYWPCQLWICHTWSIQILVYLRSVMVYCIFFLYTECSLPFHQHSIVSVSSVPFSLQSFSLSTSSKPEVQVNIPSTSITDLVTEDESPGQRTVEVAIPHVGTFVIESEEGGYDDEVALNQRDLPVWHMSENIIAHSCGPIQGFSHQRKSGTFCQMISENQTDFLCYSCVKSSFLKYFASWHKSSLNFCRVQNKTRKEASVMNWILCS